MPNPNRTKKMTDAMRNRRSRTREMKKYVIVKKIEQISLNDEQLFINSLYERLTQYSMLSKAQFAINYYNPIALINTINSQDQKRTWIQSFFDSIWNCIEIPNEEYFFGIYLNNKITQLKSKLGSLSAIGKTLTIDEFENIIAELMTRPLNSLNLLKEIILFMFSSESCSINTDGWITISKRNQNGGDVGIILIVVCIVLYIYTKIKEAI